MKRRNFIQILGGLLIAPFVKAKAVYNDGIPIFSISHPHPNGHAPLEEPLGYEITEEAFEAVGPLSEKTLEDALVWIEKRS